MITQILTKVERETWQTELAGAFNNVQDLCHFLELDLKKLPISLNPNFPLRVPHSFAKKIRKGDAMDPILKQVLPTTDESLLTQGYCADPLEEKHVNPLPGLLHKFKSRVLLITTQSCAVHCRYCFRQHFPYQDNRLSRQQWANCFDYIRRDPSLKEVILSGGDPLNLTDAHLQWFYDQLSAIPHVQIIRIHTRTPIVIPQRITPSLIQVLTSTRLKSILVYHCNHPQELCNTIQSKALSLLQAGIQVLNQSVLLSGVNNHADTLCELSWRLFECNILPYYLHLLDPVAGSQRFETPNTELKAIVDGLQQQLPGYLVPRIVSEQAGAPNKVPFIYS